MRKLLLSVALLLCLNGRGMAQQYWNVDDAGNSITWQVKRV